MPKSVILYRGHDQVGTITLQDVFLKGDIRLRKNDLIYVPGDRERVISVLGEVSKPGPVVLRPDSTLVTVLADAGGITQAAGDPTIQIIDPDKHTIQRVQFKDLLKPAGRDITLKPGEIVFIPRSGISKVGYFLQQIAPAAQIGTIGTLATR
jgi:polysaccharide export outer membrane protein